MADKKISALTAASTPLAGTEVLPIVQSGSTVKVSIANVTAGRSVSTKDLTATSGTSTPYLLAQNTNAVSLATAELQLITANTFSGVSSCYIKNESQSGGNSNADLVFFVNSTGGGSPYESARLKGVGGDLQLATGNIVINTAAKGITTGSAISLGLGTNNSVTAVTIDTSGNLGVGAAPNATSGRNITVSSIESSIALVTSGQRSFTIASGGNYQYTPGILSFIDNTAAATRMVIDSIGNVGIGTASPAATALLDVQSTTKGVRFPNMTTTQKNAITPSAGTVIFDTTLAKLCVYSGSAWQTITSI